jgi:purine-binding chemotaxis protein CheW
MKQTKPIPQIVRQQLALDSYLSTLLETVPEADDGVEEALETPQIDVMPVPLPIQMIVGLAEQKVVSPPQVFIEQANQAKIHPLSVMPEWAQQEFQALFFKVDHLILATPLTELSRTIKIERRISKIPGQPSWFIGLLDDQDSRIGVLDTGQLIFGKLRGSRRDLEHKPFQRILITEDKRWGLACDEILSIGKLQPEKVRWRTSRQKKPWLIGTVIDELTAIVDLRALVPHRRQNN